MTQGNTKKLYEAFPSLYRGRDKSPQESSMYWGFQCEDSWFDLIWNISQAIEDEARDRGLKPQSKKWPEATQVKQKFGTLRFGLVNYSDTTDVLTHKTRLASENICDVCGALASSVDNARRWCQTLCGKHAEEFLRNSSPARNQNQLPIWKSKKD